ncbi:MAG: helix-turn-helix transcriptional regulator [Ekhidna sp.]|uniref:helix-turn-helix domain-containing protein n=1 Tax=Ekhidna sp. TaxID=2608089 RepID=UPI0032F099D9
MKKAGNTRLSALNRISFGKALLIFFLLGLIFFLLSEGISSAKDTGDQNIELVEKIVITKTKVASEAFSSSSIKESIIDGVFILASLFFFLKYFSVLVRWMFSRSSSSQLNTTIKLYTLVFVLILAAIPAAKGGYIMPLQITETVILLTFYTFLIYRSIGNRPLSYKHVESSYDEKIIDRLERLMHGEKIYRNDSLRASEVAKILSVSQSALSRNIKAKYNKSFNKLINEYRIKESKVLLKDPAYENLSIEGIGFSVGFNTRSSFYNAFLELEEITPGQFKLRD